jgi:hypothetical protein
MLVTIILTIISATSSSFCALIFSKRRFKDVMYRYFTMNSVVDCLLVISKMPIAFVNSTVLATWKTSYLTKLYMLAVVLYLDRVLGLLSSLIHLKIAIDCLLWARKKYARKENRSYKTTAITFSALVLISFCNFLPKLFTTQIVELGRNDTFSNNFKYELVERESNLNVASNSTVIPLFLALLIVNVILCCNIEKNKKTLTAVQLSQPMFMGHIIVRRKNMRSQTMHLVVWLTTLSAASLLVNVLETIIFVSTSDTIFMNQKSIVFVCHVYIIFCHTANGFIYYKYSERFAACLKRIFSNACVRCCIQCCMKRKLKKLKPFRQSTRLMS